MLKIGGIKMENVTINELLELIEKSEDKVITVWLGGKNDD